MSKAARAAARGAKVGKKVEQNPHIKTRIGSGHAMPAPPLGPLLGQRGLNAANFCNDFNERTKEMKDGMPLPVRLLPDRSYKMTIYRPYTSYLLRAAAGIKKGSSRPGHDAMGMISLKHVYEIAKVKWEDDTLKEDVDLQEMCMLVIGQAKSIGIKVVPRLSVEQLNEFLLERDERIELARLAEEEALK